MKTKDKIRLGNFFGSRKEKGLSGYPLMSVTLNNGLVERKTLDRKTDSELSPEDHLMIRCGDIAYNMMRMWQGASGIAKYDGIVSPAYVVLAPKDGIDSLFASYWFKTARMLYLFWAYSYGLTKDRLRLYYKDFTQIPVSPPPLLRQQKKIAEILGTWDNAIELTEKLIQAKTRRKKGLMQQLLTGKKRFGEFVEKWEKITIGDLGVIYSGGTPDTTNFEYWNGKIYWCTPTDITALATKFISDTAKKISEKGLQRSSAKLLPINSIIVCTRATIGECAINLVPMATNQGFKNLVLKKQFDSIYVFFLITMNKHMLIKYASGSTFLEISKKDFSKIKLIIPHLKEQQKIAAVLTACDKEIELLNKKLEALKQQKKGLMQKLLTGQIRVNTAA